MICSKDKNRQGGYYMVTALFLLSINDKMVTKLSDCYFSKV
nr:MAG TPA: hypothetical protein [Caudoviricetes sp.]